MAIAAKMYNQNQSIQQLTVLQQNCQRSGEVLIGTLESGLRLKADIVLIQEPPVFRGYSHVGYTFIWGGRTLVAIKKDSDFKVRQRNEMMQDTKGDVIVIDVVGKRGKARIVNVYDQRVFDDDKHVQTSERPARQAIEQWKEVIQGTCYIAGDFNSHSQRWGNPERPRDNAYWEEVMDAFDLFYAGNKQPTRGESTIDLLFVTGEAICADINFRIVDEDDHATGSDHEMIQWETKTENWSLTFDNSTLSKGDGKSPN